METRRNRARQSHGITHAQRNEKEIATTDNLFFGAQDETRTHTTLISHYPLKVACLPIPPPGLAHCFPKQQGKGRQNFGSDKIYRHFFENTHKKHYPDRCAFRHSERSEESEKRQILRFAQDDKTTFSSPAAIANPSRRAGSPRHRAARRGTARSVYRPKYCGKSSGRTPCRSSSNATCGRN